MNKEDIIRMAREADLWMTSDERIAAVLRFAEIVEAQAAAELRRLHQICRDIYEVWAGSEGIPVPETAPEAYLLQLVEQMRDLAKEGLK